MKLIPLSEAKAHLSQYGRLCHDEPVIVTVNGVPSFQLVPLEEDDDLIGRLLEHHAAFRKLLEARLRERSVTAREALIESEVDDKVLAASGR
jgi:prevent-host-death family protein